MSSVFPGVCEVLAIFLLLHSMLISDDLPTFERPMKAYSGTSVAGHMATSGLLTSNFAFFISMIRCFRYWVCWPEKHAE